TFVALEVDGLGAAEDGVAEWDADLHAQTGTAPAAPATAAATAAAEQVLEDRATAATTAAEDIAERREDVVHRLEAATGMAHAVDALVAELVVAFALFGVGEDFIGLGRLLELGFGLLVAR